MSEKLISSGGFLAPPTDLYNMPRYFAVVTMKPWRKRLRLWLSGEPTFDVDVYDRETIPSVWECFHRFQQTERASRMSEVAENV